MKTKHITTLLWLATIGSCAAGAGLKEAGSAGFGVGLSALGVGLLFYLLVIRD